MLAGISEKAIPTTKQTKTPFASSYSSLYLSGSILKGTMVTLSLRPELPVAVLRMDSYMN